MNPILSRLLAVIKPTNPTDSVSLIHGWHRLPGNRLEFRATGFAIQMRPDPKRPPFLLTDPEGRPMVEGFVLQPMKDLAEQCAAITTATQEIHP